MNDKTITKVNRFGHVGKIVMTILLIAAILATLLSAAAAIYAATFPKDSVQVTVTNHAEFKISENSFPSVWRMLTNRYAYAADSDSSAAVQDDSGKEMRPPEDMELDTELHFFNQSYSSAEIHSVGNEKIIGATSSPVEYHCSDLVTLLVFFTLFAASAAAALLMLQKLFRVLSVCASPFCTDFVAKLRAFGYSLLPIAVFASIGETLAIRFLSAGKHTGVAVQWGVLIAFAVTMCLVVVFRYGVQLQKESDETL